ncbi:endonuclease/exonuclease/phosphatase family protein [Salinibacterium sp. SYSU T00001]|uniref:endonuclease/exonuclease/phosphatase family protein n=1 Tax=Homoserinimonas sedimenticola TaxID=2986805 RepID=UPI0022358C14|nr:endonuclease/exonuclease/phosphatase family protein [Salinibacterium sedimenticola]MCW4384446.1 endonuclease/exonuclease/phosphatase family protein [Salinibacterium sedimenticola]
MTSATKLGQNDAPLVGPQGDDLHLMSYNIRRIIRGTRHGSPDFWPRRRGLVERLLRAESPTVLGVQEALHSQADDLSAMLGPHMHRIGRGRSASGTGEGCPVFYDSRRLELVRWRQLALSPTPSSPGSRGWGNLVPRIAVAAEFARRDTGQRFGLLNAHLDHLSRRSRIRSTEMIASLAQRAEHPVIVMGDFNTTPRSAPYRALRSAGLRDTWVVASERRGRARGTYSGFGAPQADGRRIDWMFVSAGLEVVTAAINTTRFEGRAASDHEPIQAVLRFS